MHNDGKNFCTCTLVCNFQWKRQCNRNLNRKGDNMKWILQSTKTCWNGKRIDFFLLATFLFNTVVNLKVLFNSTWLLKFSWLLERSDVLHHGAILIFMTQGTAGEKQMARRTSGHCTVVKWGTGWMLGIYEVVNWNKWHGTNEQGIHRMGNWRKGR